MSRIEARIAKLEAKAPPDSTMECFVMHMPDGWTDCPEVRAAQKKADALGKHLMVVKTPPDHKPSWLSFLPFLPPGVATDNADDLDEQILETVIGHIRASLRECGEGEAVDAMMAGSAKKMAPHA